MVIWVFPKIGVPPKHPKMIIFSRKTYCFVGYHHFWKHPYDSAQVIHPATRRKNLIFFQSLKVVNIAWKSSGSRFHVNSPIPKKGPRLESPGIPIGSMRLVYLPTWVVDLYGKCRYIHHTSERSESAESAESAGNKLFSKIRPCEKSSGHFFIPSPEDWRPSSRPLVQKSISWRVCVFFHKAPPLEPRRYQFQMDGNGDFQPFPMQRFGMIQVKQPLINVWPWGSRVCTLKCLSLITKIFTVFFASSQFCLKMWPELNWRSLVASKFRGMKFGHDLVSTWRMIPTIAMFKDSLLSISKAHHFGYPAISFQGCMVSHFFHRFFFWAKGPRSTLVIEITRSQVIQFVTLFLIPEIGRSRFAITFELGSRKFSPSQKGLQRQNCQVIVTSLLRLVVLSNKPFHFRGIPESKLQTQTTKFTKSWRKWNMKNEPPSIGRMQNSISSGFQQSVRTPSS